MTAKKILFVNDEMAMGGVARVLNTLMAELPEDLYDIDLLVLHNHGEMLGDVPAKVRILSGTSFFNTVDESLANLWARKDWKAIFSKIRLLFYMKTGLIKDKIRRERQKILDTQYDVEVAAKEGFCTVFTACGDSKRKINWVLTDYSVCNYSSNHMGLVKNALQKIDLNIADSRQALIAYETVFRVQNGIDIHNLMKTDKILEGKNEETPELLDTDLPKCISGARFHPQKSIDRLLKASRYAWDQGYAHELYLIGGGEEEEKLRNLAKELRLDHVYFLGYKDNPYSYMHQCDLFVLSSLYEGFATVISESLIAGTPVLTTNVSGCEEQITDPLYGWITENSQKGLNEGLTEALKDRNKLGQMKDHLKDYVYPNEEILQQFIKVL
ncbi:MAG: glycosyltransferase [Solobacterium sp.]|nr:glycosyltransferase [Solobacterium sp.]